MAGQPENFGFGEDEAMLRDAARRFFQDHYGADALHTLVAGDSDLRRPNVASWEPDHWRQVVELGWPAVCVPEAAGGVGMPLVAAVALAEEAGRAGFPSPLLSTFQAAFLLQACDTAAARDALRDIAGGNATCVAMHDRRGEFGDGATDVTCAGGRLHGAASFVQEARKADRFLVRARQADGHRNFRAVKCLSYCKFNSYLKNFPVDNYFTLTSCSPNFQTIIVVYRLSYILHIICTFICVHMYVHVRIHIHTHTIYYTCTLGYIWNERSVIVNKSY